MSTDELAERLRSHSPSAFQVQGGRDLYLEISDRSDGRVWMTTGPVTVAEGERFEVEAPWVKTGVGSASMDAAAFRRSPDGNTGVAVETREIQGVEFLCVARPLGIEPPKQEGGPLHVRVDKHHTLAFAAGRELNVLELEGERYVEVVGSPERDAELLLPPGATLTSLKLEEPWIVELPTPTTAFFWMAPVMRSFQGPVQLPG